MWDKKGDIEIRDEKGIKGNIYRKGE